MKDVLFLDDDGQRTAEFLARTQSLPCTVVTVETADECIQQLSQQVFDLVLLDHDLGGEIYVDSGRRDTGMEVVRFLQNNPSSHGSFIVHSFNPIGAAGMYLALSSMGYRVDQVPFGSPEFYHALYDRLGYRNEPPPEKKSVGDKMRGYLRGFRK